MKDHTHTLTMGSGYDWVDVSEEEETSNERLQSVWLSIREFLVDKGPRGLAEPPDAKGNLVDRFLQDSQDLEYKVLQHRDMFGYQLLHSWVAFSLGDEGEGRGCGIKLQKPQ